METLIVFDFDWSLIDCNSDTWVVEKLGAMGRMKSFRDTLPWTQLMVKNNASRSISHSTHFFLVSSCLLQFVQLPWSHKFESINQRPINQRVFCFQVRCMWFDEI